MKVSFRVTAAPLVLAVALTSCGSDKKSSSSDDPSTSTSPSASESASVSPSATPDAGSEEATAARINLTAADVGTGFTANSKADSSEVVFQEALFRCVGLTPKDPPGDELVSDFFVTKDDAQISSQVDLFDGPEDARADFGAYTSAKTAPCLQTAIRAVLLDQTSDGAVSELKVTPRDDLESTDTAAFYYLGNFTGSSVKVECVLAVILRGNILSTVESFGTTLGTISPATVTKAVVAVTTRATAEANATP